MIHRQSIYTNRTNVGISHADDYAVSMTVIYFDNWLKMVCNYHIFNIDVIDVDF